MISAEEARKPINYLEEDIKKNYLPRIENEIRRSSSNSVKMDFTRKSLTNEIKNRIKEILTDKGYTKISFKDVDLDPWRNYRLSESELKVTYLEFHW